MGVMESNVNGCEVVPETGSVGSGGLGCVAFLFLRNVFAGSSNFLGGEAW